EIVNRGREYVIAARDFKELTAGWKRQPVRAKEVKFAAVLEKEIDNSKPPTDWITIEFMVTANTKYRFWAFVGGCCEPEMMFKVQGDDVVLTMGDGQSKAFPIDGPSAISFGATPIGSHSGHGGQTRWGWSRMFELTYPSGGVKRIRFIPAARGTALSHFVVSSGRYLQANPPPPNELENGQ
ncbi:MAG TPA: hypothetical protein VI643_04765, partial [Planctomycetota bacterium]|nr:hypothetical protein [Planctomycetota bacterium]